MGQLKTQLSLFLRLTSFISTPHESRFLVYLPFFPSQPWFFLCKIIHVEAKNETRTAKSPPFQPGFRRWTGSISLAVTVQMFSSTRDFLSPALKMCGALTDPQSRAVRRNKEKADLQTLLVFGSGLFVSLFHLFLF